ncbi:MAG: HAMP domain-containing protein, partial [Gammaproteobacteria bacterium]|nr:HAMP domain-containing protein [Gammaproteobacteria bacterium]
MVAGHQPDSLADIHPTLSHHRWRGGPDSLGQLGGLVPAQPGGRGSASRKRRQRARAGGGVRRGAVQQRAGRGRAPPGGRGNAGRFPRGHGRHQRVPRGVRGATGRARGHGGGPGAVQSHPGAFRHADLQHHRAARRSGCVLRADATQGSPAAGAGGTARAPRRHHDSGHRRPALLHHDRLPGPGHSAGTPAGAFLGERVRTLSLPGRTPGRRDVVHATAGDSVHAHRSFAGGTSAGALRGRGQPHRAQPVGPGSFPTSRRTGACLRPAHRVGARRGERLQPAGSGAATGRTPARTARGQPGHRHRPGHRSRWPGEHGPDEHRGRHHGFGECDPHRTQSAAGHQRRQRGQRTAHRLLFVGRVLLFRLEQLSRWMRRMAGGDLETTVDIGGNDEVADMAAALE